MLFTFEKKVNLILWIVLAILPPIFVIPMYFLTKFGLSNSLLIPSVIYLGIAGLVFVHRAGTFDTFEYQLGKWFKAWKKNPKSGQTANEFHLERKRKRKHNPFPYIPFLTYGTILLVLCIIFAYIII